MLNDEILYSISEITHTSMTDITRTVSDIGTCMPELRFLLIKGGPCVDITDNLS